MPSRAARGLQWLFGVVFMLLKSKNHLYLPILKTSRLETSHVRLAEASVNLFWKCLSVLDVSLKPWSESHWSSLIKSPGLTTHKEAPSYKTWGTQRVDISSLRLYPSIKPKQTEVNQHHEPRRLMFAACQASGSQSADIIAYDYLYKFSSYLMGEIRLISFIRSLVSPHASSAFSESRVSCQISPTHTLVHSFG